VAEKKHEADFLVPSGERSQLLFPHHLSTSQENICTLVVPQLLVASGITRRREGERKESLEQHP